MLRLICFVSNISRIKITDKKNHLIEKQNSFIKLNLSIFACERLGYYYLTVKTFSMAKFNREKRKRKLENIKIHLNI